MITLYTIGHLDELGNWLPDYNWDQAWDITDRSHMLVWYPQSITTLVPVIPG